MKKRKRIIIITIAVLVLGISSVYAATIIKSSDVLYDNNNSNGNSNNVQGALDELYSLTSSNSCIITNEKIINENMINYITNLAATDTTNLAYDDTDDKNLRYIGTNPNNYVLFNDELWRIIGVMNNVKDSDGTGDSRIKLIREESIGNIAFNTENTSNWSNSTLQKLLNSGDYFNKSNNYINNGLNQESKSMITSVVWNLGGHSTSLVTASNIYNLERGSSVPTGNSTTWTGYVGLMYPSDYGYAIGGSDRNSCLKKDIVKYSTDDCYNNDYLYKSDSYQWTLIPSIKNIWHLFAIMKSGIVDNGSGSTNDYTVRPVVYLDTKLYVTRGEGSLTNPYRISFKKEQVITDPSGASIPKLDDEGKLIPVTLSDDGTVTYIRENNTNWYNYDEQRWANAVILVDSPSKSYKVGDTILESDIESYFVWIPKYKYKLWNTGTASKNAHEIDIVFDTKDTNDVEGVSCKTPMTSGATGNCDNGEYMTHPAFISLGVDGFWVGKFETGYKGATSTSAAQVNSSDSSKIIIKPNVYSWRNNTVYNFFLSAYNYERTLDSHMMKNTEWGAVAILSHSKYGINKEVNINNNSMHRTGYSGLTNLDQSTHPGTYGDGTSYNQVYNTPVGYLASTTGNITGVYDMSGGAYEYMASYITENLGNSGFSAASIANYNAKYFDIYSGSSSYTAYQYRILGDATGETGPFVEYPDGDGSPRYHNSWYADYSYFLMSTSSWFARGGLNNNGALAGIFAFQRQTGGIIDSYGSRMVLSG